MLRKLLRLYFFSLTIASMNAQSSKIVFAIGGTPAFTSA